jgi:RNA polymerase sigma-70 factor (ECF subfamily)
VVQADLERRRQFEAVVDVVYEPLQRYLGRRAQPADVSELLNDSLIVIWRRLDQIPFDDPLPWTYGVAKRCLANHRRGAQRRLRLVRRVIDRAPRDSFASRPPGAEFEHAQLETALYELDESDRELVRLWAWEQLEPREIAVVLDMTPNAVSLRLTRAKKKICSSMERQNLAAAGHERLGHVREPRS